MQPLAYPPPATALPTTLPAVLLLPAPTPLPPVLPLNEPAHPVPPAPPPNQPSRPVPPALPPNQRLRPAQLAPPPNQPPRPAQPVATLLPPAPPPNEPAHPVPPAPPPNQPPVLAAFAIHGTDATRLLSPLSAASWRRALPAAALPRPKKLHDAAPPIAPDEPLLPRPANAPSPPLPPAFASPRWQSAASLPAKPHIKDALRRFLHHRPAATDLQLFASPR